MSRYIFLLGFGCFSTTWIYSFQIQAVSIELDDEIHAKKSFMMSLNNSDDNDEEIHAEENLSTMEKQSGYNLSFPTLNRNETELSYVPAFPLQETGHQIHEDNSSSEEQLLDKNIPNQEAFPNESLRNAFNTYSSVTTSTTLNKVIVNLRETHDQTESLKINTTDYKTEQIFNDISHTTSIPVSENMLNFTHEQSPALEAIQNSSSKFLNPLKNSFQNLCPFYVPQPLTHRIDIHFSVLNESIQHDDLLKLFVIHLQHALHEKKCESIVPLSFTYGKHLIYSWTNASISSKYCDETMLIHMQNKMFKGSLLNMCFTRTFLPYFNIEEIAIIKLGICTSNPQTIGSGTAAVMMVLALTILPCCFLASVKFIHYRKLKLKNKKDIVLCPRHPIILDSDCGNSISKTHGPTSVNYAFEPEIYIH